MSLTSEMATSWGRRVMGG